VVGRDGIEPPTLRFSAECDSSGTVRHDSVRVALALISRALGGLAIQRDTGLCGSVRIGLAERRQNRAQGPVRPASAGNTVQV
jgi:hypothetical protein